MSNQSSIEWLNDELASLNFDYLTGLIDNKEYNERHKSILEQAKAMHKDEHAATARDWWVEGASDAHKTSTGRYESFHDYYEKKFNQ